MNRTTYNRALGSWCIWWVAARQFWICERQPSTQSINN